ncbi:DUF397 domain-containing protein [Streptomyces gilvosporeus]|uniref:DUF397 domain-containing protein n=1 Tax=Streptomyces gilvosporeus TaxID=553510 RepID=A0A1V0TS35_9ACTN|nr:DUF397 domain-containing protein [Streptomyces gilvosporeus]ARF55727.1 DUF397 domain-containing protein [Streptomyces gilvosporeus]
MAQAIVWQKSSFSGGQDGPNCVELAVANSSALLRESDAPAQVLSVTPAALAALMRHLRGEAE